LLDARNLRSPNELSQCDRLDSRTYGWASGYAITDDDVLWAARLAGAAQAALQAPNPPSALADLNGSYAIVLVGADDGVIDVITDRVGTRPLFYSIQDDRVLISDDFWRLVEALPSPRLSVPAAIELLTFDYVLGEHTLVDGVHEFPAGTHTRFTYDREAGATQITGQDRYWRFDMQPRGRPADDMIEELDTVFEAVAQRTARLLRALDVGRVGLNLTAGGDSRLLARLLHAQGIPLHCVTSAWVPQENTAAFQISQFLRCQHTFLPFWASTASKPDPRVFWALAPTTKFSVANHVLGLATYGLPDVDLTCSGHLGDMLAGSHLTLAMYLRRKDTRQRMAQSSAARQVRLSPGSLRPLLRRPHAEAAGDGRAHWEHLVANADTTHDLTAGILVDLEQRQRRFILRDYLAQRQLNASILILNDYALQDFCRTVPFEWQLATSLYFSTLHDRVLTGEYAPLRNIPLNGVMLRRVRSPRLTAILRLARDRANAVVRRGRRRLGQFRRSPADRTMTDRTYWQHDLVRDTLAHLDWLCDPQLVEQLLTQHAGSDRCAMSWSWSFYTLAEVSKRVRAS
jgi:asparagine synthetase B (glutamine-hydrolysing)